MGFLQEDGYDVGKDQGRGLVENGEEWVEGRRENGKTGKRGKQRGMARD